MRSSRWLSGMAALAVCVGAFQPVQGATRKIVIQRAPKRAVKKAPLRGVRRTLSRSGHLLLPVIPLPKAPAAAADLPNLIGRYTALTGLDPRARGPLLSVVHPSRVSLALHDLRESSGAHQPEPGSIHTAAVDLYVVDLSVPEIRHLLDTLGRAGFAAWYRYPGRDGWPSRYLPHVHAVYAGVPLKAQLRGQVRDYLRGRNGLRSHARYAFHRFHPKAVATVHRLFHSNGASRIRLPRRTFR